MVDNVRINILSKQTALQLGCDSSIFHDGQHIAFNRNGNKLTNGLK